MERRSLFWQILWPFLVLLLMALAALAWETSVFLRDFYLDQTAANLEVDARVIERQLQGLLDKAHEPDVNGLCKEIGTLSGKRVTVVLPSGEVIGDSNEDPAKMDNHADRPEIREAFAGRTGRSIRYSHTLHTDLIYVTIPVHESGQPTGVVRVSTSLASVKHVLRRVYMRTALASSVVALSAAIVSLLITRRIARPIRRMKEGAERFAQGDFRKRLGLPDSTELADLASAMNRMADDLDARIQTIYRQRDELDAVISSMQEGVLAVDMEERVLNLNHAAARLFGTTAEAARGRNIQETVRNSKLQQCVARTLGSGKTTEDEVIFAGAEECHLQVVSTLLHDEKGNSVGALLVLNDVTRLRRLERARSDFVANVSHEIRTPVTSIKGYAETLLGGALADPEAAGPFLAIIARQADRLSSLVDDILSLATLERAEHTGDVSFDAVPLHDIIEAAIHVCTPKASGKQISFAVVCAAELAVPGNAPLLEQALVNLLDNATKYSEPGCEVRIEAMEAKHEITVNVRDTGCGIAPEHLSRIFERFYRVDRARSRALGGTGLGLAIVKHIVTLHGGQVTAESTLGKGSCFTLHLPVAQPR